MPKFFMILMVLALHFLLPVVSQAQVKDYDYPFTNPLAATVVGTPKAYKADLPQDIPVEMWELEVFPDREIPDLLWYDKITLFIRTPRFTGSSHFHHCRYWSWIQLTENASLAAHVLSSGISCSFSFLTNTWQFHRVGFQHWRARAPLGGFTRSLSRDAISLATNSGRGRS